MAIRRTGWALLLIVPMLGNAASHAGDWPTWRFDAGRTACSPEILPPELQLQWTMQLEPRKQAWDDPLNLDLMPYDRVFEPVVIGGRMLIGFNDRDKVVAVDTKTGATQWTFFTDAPVRLPPVCGDGRVYFSSDDGHLYCVDAETGKLFWKFQGGPSPQKVIGNRRIISAWPARGGPVLKDGCVYFAGSIWPFMGVFIYALDAETGNAVWMNDGSGSQYILQPHKAPSFAGVAPQGCLVATQDFLLIAGGRTVPAAYRRNNGEFVHFLLNDGGKANGGSFVAANDAEFFVHTRLRGVRAFDLATGKKTNFETNEPVLSKDCIYAAATVKERSLIRCYNQKKEVVWELEADASGDLIQAGDRLYAAGAKQLVAVELPKDGRPARVVWSQPVDPGIVRLLAADQRLFAVNLDGRILAFGPEKVPPATIREAIVPLKPSADAVTRAEQLFNAGDTAGYALWYGAEEEELLDAVVSRSTFAELVIVDPDPARVERLRGRYDQAGCYGAVSVHVGEPQDFRPRTTSRIASLPAGSSRAGWPATSPCFLLSMLRCVPTADSCTYSLIQRRLRRWSKRHPKRHWREQSLGRSAAESRCTGRGHCQGPRIGRTSTAISPIRSNPMTSACVRRSVSCGSAATAISTSCRATAMGRPNRWSAAACSSKGTTA